MSEQKFTHSMYSSFTGSLVLAFGVKYFNNFLGASLSTNLSMKKSQKATAKSCAYNWVPDHHYAVEITCESDGRRQMPNGKSGSSGASDRFDSETASEDSYKLKRKSMHLSSAGHKMDEFGIPINVFPISQMSRSEMIDLREKLRFQLNQVRSVRQRIENKDIQLTSSGSVPTVSDGYVSRMEFRRSENKPGKSSMGACSVETSRLRQKDHLGSQAASQIFTNEKRTFKSNLLHRNSEDLSDNNKVVCAEKQMSKGGLTGVKRGLLGRFESRDAKKQRVALAQSAANVLRRLMTHKYGWVFNEPVDPVKLNIPDYFKIITRPMDLGTIKTRLERDYYSSLTDFAGDVRLTFSNAMKYNPPGNDFHFMAQSLNKFFEIKWKEVETKLAGEEGYRKLTQGVQLIPTKKQQNISEMENKPRTSSNTNCVPSSHVTSEKKPKSESRKRPMSYEEKRKLSDELQVLAEDMPEQIMAFIRNHNALNQSDGEIELDIDMFDSDTLWELQILATKCLRDREQDAKPMPVSTGPDDVAANPIDRSHQEYHPTKIAQQGGDAGDEYVDVGGDDMPTTTFPTVDIDKDTAASTKCSSSSSSSSSSSDSGSSSSDSDSESSSESDSDSDEVCSADAPNKETIESTAASKHMTQSDPEITGAVSVLDEECAHPKGAVSDADAHQEGESAPPERQVSPDKLVRRALLRNRFADTILKAHEKTLNQVNKGDPEKLRHEREQLEKWQREEKARLQAEAKAAEAVRKKAEAEAAAEAKRKIEMEREAARQALQNLEKSVEIDEDSQFMKNLEEMKYVTDDHVPSSGDETSPVNSMDGLGNFKLQGKNPLEQLGLFMKIDEEDEEAIADCAAGNGDVEEGEID